MTWWRRVRERKAWIASAKAGNGERDAAADELATAHHKLHETKKASAELDRLAPRLRRALGVHR